MNELALFAGAGGGILGTRLLGWRCVCAVEIDAYCREILLRRQEEGHLAPFPIWDDAHTFYGPEWAGKVDVITAGFPCQPFSNAGKGEAEKDPRNMWPETIRIIREVAPRFCLLENSRGLTYKKYFGTILNEISAGGYCVRWRVISAAELGAPHRRDRVWIMAHAVSGWGRAKNSQGCNLAREVAISSCDGSENSGSSIGSGKNRRGWWKPEPKLDRVADGVARRLDRAKAIGNGQVPAVVKAAWELLANAD